ncbi:Fur family transcriptional regulator [Flavobacterium sp.]|jgi:Fur family ferric uptake transcriptional regulator|uniref:Fur family transcriptional regulator n=1 Tax=Flavobacterium sp. TaxID=239 RepID=UPI0022BF3A19|nr:transcriptional repressor [Flavobacterium sp.]MCZ8145918.1 transcriptional repressor [Flavobacterium sp.]MCZ8366775.1 transcriptional repressor [Flavobacterium sp.]
MKKTRNTPAKAAIVKVLSESHQALSHAEILEKTQQVCDRVTVYRILDRLLTSDIIHKTVTAEGVVKYAFCRHEAHHDHNHVHFNCTRCQKTECLSLPIPEFKLPHAYTVHDMNFTLTGVCPECQVV